MGRVQQTVLLLTFACSASSSDIFSMIEMISTFTRTDIQRHMNIDADAARRSVDPDTELQYDVPLYQALKRFRRAIAEQPQDVQDFITLMFRVARKTIDGEPGDLMERLLVAFDKPSVKCSPFFLNYKDTIAYKDLHANTRTVCPSQGATPNIPNPHASGTGSGGPEDKVNADIKEQFADVIAAMEKLETKCFTAGLDLNDINNSIDEVWKSYPVTKDILQDVASDMNTICSNVYDNRGIDVVNVLANNVAKALINSLSKISPEAKRHKASWTKMLKNAVNERTAKDKCDKLAILGEQMVEI